jgi:hypothetical protein
MQALNVVGRFENGDAIVGKSLFYKSLRSKFSECGTFSHCSVGRRECSGGSQFWFFIVVSLSRIRQNPGSYFFKFRFANEVRHRLTTWLRWHSGNPHLTSGSCGLVTLARKARRYTKLENKYGTRR